MMRSAWKFFHFLKKECIRCEYIFSREEMRTVMFNYIE
ncbi:IS3 family transposase [Pectobacterium versatile]|nr:IS3 family transposase [Pectobacterium versatile]